MPKRSHRFPILGQAGMTLVEIMVSVGLVGICFSALMFLLFQSGKTGGKMAATFESIEGAAEGVALFGTVIPEVTRITGCLCGTTNSRASCAWSSANPFSDPVMTAGNTNPVNVLQGEFEAYDGQQSTTNMAALVTNAITIPGETCAASSSSMTASMMRGCKLSFKLKYTAPVDVSGSTPSTSGQIWLSIGSNRGAGIGQPTSNGVKGLGISKFSCGFEQGAGGATGSVFVMNILLKAKSNTVANTSNTLLYETWYPHDLDCKYNYCKGSFRELQLKYTMRNLVHRGVYFWRPESHKACSVVGTTVASPAYCCSQAWNGTKCTTCAVAGATGGPAESCCSGRLGAGGACI